MSIHGGHVPYLQRIESPSNADGATGSASQDFRNFLRQNSLTEARVHRHA